MCSEDVRGMERERESIQLLSLAVHSAHSIAELDEHQFLKTDTRYRLSIQIQNKEKQGQCMNLCWFREVNKFKIPSAEEVETLSVDSLVPWSRNVEVRTSRKEGTN